MGSLVWKIIGMVLDGMVLLLFIIMSVSMFINNPSNRDWVVFCSLAVYSTAALIKIEIYKAKAEGRTE